jgi:hypothetical protein
MPRERVREGGLRVFQRRIHSLLEGGRAQDRGRRIPAWRADTQVCPYGIGVERGVRRGKRAPAHAEDTGSHAGLPLRGSVCKRRRRCGVGLDQTPYSDLTWFQRRIHWLLEGAVRSLATARVRTSG